MELFLVNTFAFLRPLLFADVAVQVAGFSIFELAAVGLALLLFAAMLVRAVGARTFCLSPVDIVILLFVLWCTIVYVAFMELASLKEYAKLVLPFTAYTIARNVIGNRENYLFMLRLMIFGFVAPVIVSAILTSTGKGVYTVNYWTDEARYDGIYDNVHNAGHNMAFFVMLCLVYLAVRFQGAAPPRDYPRWKLLLFGLMFALAAYCLYKTSVRTALLGLVIFVAVFLYFYKKSLLLMGAVLGASSVLVFSSAFNTLFYDFAKVYEGEWDAGEMASARPERWGRQWETFSSQSIEHLAGGVGIGNTVSKSDLEEGVAAAVDSHNDFLDVLVQTGIVGFVLFMILQGVLLKKILEMEGREKYAFLALFVAVNAMNFGSNSYVSRFGLAQMYYLLLIYVEMRRPETSDARNRIAAVPALGRAPS